MTRTKALTEAERTSLMAKAHEVTQQLDALLTGTPFEAVVVVTLKGTAARLAGEVQKRGCGSDVELEIAHACFADGLPDREVHSGRSCAHAEETYAAFQAAGWVVEEAYGAVRGPTGQTFCPACATFACLPATVGGLPTCGKCGAAQHPPDEEREPAKPAMH
jgi:hypothetical protein